MATTAGDEDVARHSQAGTKGGWVSLDGLPGLNQVDAGLLAELAELQTIGPFHEHF